MLAVVTPAHLEMVEQEAVAVEQPELSPLKSGPLLEQMTEEKTSDTSLYSSVNIYYHLYSSNIT